MLVERLKGCIFIFKKSSLFFFYNFKAALVAHPHCQASLFLRFISWNGVDAMLMASGSSWFGMCFHPGSSPSSCINKGLIAIIVDLEGPQTNQLIVNIIIPKRI